MASKTPFKKKNRTERQTNNSSILRLILSLIQVDKKKPDKLERMRDIIGKHSLCYSKSSFGLGI